MALSAEHTDELYSNFVDDTGHTANTLLNDHSLVSHHSELYKPLSAQPIQSHDDDVDTYVLALQHMGGGSSTRAS